MPLMSLLISGNSAQIVPTCWLQMLLLWENALLSGMNRLLPLSSPERQNEIMMRKERADVEMEIDRIGQSKLLTPRIVHSHAVTQNHQVVVLSLLG